MVLVAPELLGVPGGVAELLAAALVAADFVAEVLGCAVDCRCDVTGVLRAGVVRRFGVCANDDGESASSRAMCTTTRVSGSTSEIRGDGLTKRFIRELIVLDAPRAVLNASRVILSMIRLLY